MRKSFQLTAGSLTVILFGLGITLPVSAQNVRPFKLDGKATWDDLNNAFVPNVGAAFQDGHGTARHLGRFSATGNLFATDAPNMNGDFPVIGTVVLVAANRDEVHAVFSGVLNTNGNGIADYMFVGGTGRFEGAGGSGGLVATLDLSGGLQNVPMDVDWLGTIIY